jgi:tRNA pseudouridine38-40 synthase
VGRIVRDVRAGRDELEVGAMAKAAGHDDPAGRRTYRLDIQYDGGGFYGWARQTGHVTVEESLESALRVVLRQPVRLSVAGRTDTGVHARHQVASFVVPWEKAAPTTAEGRTLEAWESLRTESGRGRILLSVNALTPNGLVVRAIAEAPRGFDARRDAVARSYRYFIWRDLAPDPFRQAYSWHLRDRLDVESMREAAAACVGSHDFTAFTPTETHHKHFKRDIERCEWRIRGSLLWLEVRAPHFLRHMVRSLVGTMVEVGRGRMTPDHMKALLRGAARANAGPTAPAHGLFLWRVHY